VRHFGSVDVFLEALERSRPGDVLVIDNAGRLDEGCVGDLIAIEAQAAGIAGILCWGAVRDCRELRQIGLPIFAYGTMPVGPITARRQEHDALEWGRFGSVIVSEQDTVFADEDGGVFVASAALPGVMETASMIATIERGQAEQVRSGICLRDQFQFDEYLRLRALSPGYSLREHLARHNRAIEA
jgi:regulator of RNase E activity RraA